MAVQINTIVRGWVDADGLRLPFGGDDIPSLLTGTSPGTAGEQVFPLAIGASTTVWDLSVAGAAPSFKFLYLAADQTCLIEFQYGGLAANNGRLTIFGGGPPLMLGSDDALAYNAAGNFAGAAAKITKILAKNTSGVAARLTRLIVQ